MWFYLAMGVVGTPVWLGVLLWNPRWQLNHATAQMIFWLPMWACITGSVLAITGGIAALRGKPAKRLFRHTVYCFVAAFVLFVLLVFAWFVCMKAGVDLPL